MSGPGGRVSIVVPTRGDSWALRAMLASLDTALPLDADVEVILVHDGDGTALTDDLVAGFGHPLTRTWTGHRSGPAAARNHGADLATGATIVFLDDDVIVPHGWYGNLGRALAEHPDAGLLGGPLRSVAERNPVSQMFEALVIRHEHRDGRWYLASACLAARPAALRTLGGFDAALSVSGEDWDLSRRAHAAGIPVAHSPHLTIHHRNPTHLRQLLSRAWTYGSSFGASGVVDVLDPDRPAEVAGVHLPTRLGALRPWLRAVSGFAATLPTELARRWRSLRSGPLPAGTRVLVMLLHIPWYATYLTSCWASQLALDRGAVKRSAREASSRPAPPPPLRAPRSPP